MSRVNRGHTMVDAQRKRNNDNARTKERGARSKMYFGMMLILKMSLSNAAPIIFTQKKGPPFSLLFLSWRRLGRPRCSSPARSRDRRNGANVRENCWRQRITLATLRRHAQRWKIPELKRWISPFCNQPIVVLEEQHTLQWIVERINSKTCFNHWTDNATKYGFCEVATFVGGYPKNLNQDFLRNRKVVVAWGESEQLHYPRRWWFPKQKWFPRSKWFPSKG